MAHTLNPLSPVLLASAPSSDRLSSRLLPGPAFLSVCPSHISSSSNSSSTRLLPVRAALASAPPKYELPTWATFELGLAPVFWETANGKPPSSGELLTVWYNPEYSQLIPSADFGLAFNGGFNSPIMCGGEPRLMTRKGRGPNCTPFYSIKINVPVHAKFIEFSFTDGKVWDGPFVLDLLVPSKWRNQPISFFNERLREEMANESACADAIFPDSSYIQDRCLLPGGLTHEEGQSCALDIVPGCMDISSPFYDPLATVDDGSCPIDVPAKSA